MAMKAQAFSIMVNDVPRNKSKQQPQSARSQKGPNGFKFLKRDEGKLAVQVPQQLGDSHPNLAHVRQQRATERAQMLAEMQRSQRAHVDPFAEALVAVPKKSPRGQAASDALQKQHNIENDGRTDSPASSSGAIQHSNQQQHQAPMPRDNQPGTHEQHHQQPNEMNNSLPHPSAATVAPPATRRGENPPRAQQVTDTTAMDDFGDEEEDYFARREEQQSRQPPSPPQDDDYEDHPGRGYNQQQNYQQQPESNRLSHEYRLRPSGGPARRILPPSTTAMHGAADIDDNGVQSGNFFRRTPQQQALTPRPSVQGHQQPNAQYIPMRRAAPSNAVGYNDELPAAGVHRPVVPPLPAIAPEDDPLMFELQHETELARREKQRYQQLRQKLDREFEERMAERGDLQHERDEFERWANEEKRALRREKRLVEDERRRLSESTAGERDQVRRLQQEIEGLRETNERLSSQNREKERTLKTENERLRREVADLTTRNAELTEMVRTQQREEANQRLKLQQQQQQQRGRELRSAPLIAKNSSTVEDEGSQPSRDEQEEDVEEEEEEEYEEDNRYQQQRDFGQRHKLQAPSNNARVAAEHQQPGNQPQVRGSRSGAITSDALQREIDEEYMRLKNQQQRVSQPPPKLAEEQQIRRDQERRTTSSSNAAAYQAATTTTPAAVIQKKSAAIDNDMNRGSTRLPKSIPTIAEFINDNEPLPEEENPSDVITARSVGADGKTEKLYRSGKREINYANGTRKLVLPTGHVTLHFGNGDRKRTYPSGKSTYWYHDNQTLHTQLPTGIQIYQFQNGQTEKHFPDASKEILYPDGVFKVMYADGSDETKFRDGSVRKSGPGGIPVN